jgi:hypothetical protein
MWLGSAKGGVTLRLAKEITATEDNEIAPAFNQCIIDPKHGTIRLIPPTGLLGTFFSGQQGRDIKFHQVHNVERRHTIARRYVEKEDANRLVTEVIYTTHSWGIFLTLADESLLLAQTSHTTSSEITDQRARQEDKFAVNSTAGIQYLRQHQADQKRHDAAAEWAESAAVIIAGTIGIRLVKTEVEQDTT